MMTKATVVVCFHEPNGPRTIRLNCERCSLELRTPFLNGEFVPAFLYDGSDGWDFSMSGLAAEVIDTVPESESLLESDDGNV